MIEKVQQVLPTWANPQFGIMLVALIFGFGVSWNQLSSQTESIKKDFALVETRFNGELAALRAETTAKTEASASRIISLEQSWLREISGLRNEMERLNNRLDRMQHGGNSNGRAVQ